MERREFVRRVGVGLAGAMALPGSVLAERAHARKLQRVGIQAYSVRHELARDRDGTLRALRAIGYRDIEVNWHLGMTPGASLKSALESAGLRAPSAHINADTMLVGWKRHLDAAARMGHEQLSVAGMPEDSRQTLDDWREWADRFNQAGAVAKRHGIRLTFHTEPWAYTALQGQHPIDVFIQRLDPSVARVQLDTGNLAMAGADPATYLERFPERIGSFHLKDVPVIGKQGDTELGKGKLDFKRMLSLVRRPDTLYFVEQEDAARELDSARQDYDYISALEY